MIINDIKQVYELINKRNVFTNIEKPIIYEIPKVKGIHYTEHGKTIKDVYPNTLEYIIYNLHDIDYSFLIESIMALFYYWKFRKNNKTKLNQVYKEIVNHYSSINKKIIQNYDKGKCVYLLEIRIGSKTLYKVGKTTNFKDRISNLDYDIKSKYSFVSSSIKPLQVVYSSNFEEIEKSILNELNCKNQKKHNFYFNGHTESFENIEIISIYNNFVRELKT